MAGDGRVNENIGLTAVHHVFHSEHNRLADHTKDVVLSDAAQLLAGGATQAEAVAFLNEWLAVDVVSVPTTPAEIAALQWDGERLFQAAKFGTEMQYQHLVFEEFARKVQPMVDAFLAPEGFDTTINPAIVAEFAHTVYRFGHSMLLDTIDRLDPNFASSEIGLIEAFLNPLAFDASGTLSAEEAAGAIVRGTTRQIGNAIDEFKTEALRNNLLGLPLDLATINLARGRDTGIPSLNAARREFYDMTGDSQLTPYTSWIDFVQHLRHPESLVNFIAAYGTHAELTALDVDTLAEKRAVADALVFGGSAVINAGTPEERTFIADDADRIAFLNSTGIYASLAERRDHHRSRRHRPVDRRPRRGDHAVRRLPRLDLQLRVRDAAGEPAERRPAVLPGPPCGAQLPDRDGGQLVRQIGDAQHRHHASPGRHLLDAGLHPRGRPDAAVQRQRVSTLPARTASWVMIPLTPGR